MANLIRFLPLFPVLFLAVPSAFAEKTSFSRAGFNITLEPVVGFETTQRGLPSPHAKSMFIYGARFTAGNRMLAAEGEYTRGSDNEVFASPAMTVNTEKDNIRLGVRTIQGLASWVDGVLRAGGQASRVKVKVTQLGQTQSYGGDWDIHPYAGAGLTLKLVRYFALAAEATYVFRDLKDWSRNEIQFTAGIRLSI